MAADDDTITFGIGRRFGKYPPVTLVNDAQVHVVRFVPICADEKVGSGALGKKG
ncbi:hypothetical protein [Bradyrhizobium glycinis]|uniref:hypothetical protein n=1 Tax=Bradyrhizobium glycinis TaxID=2751812 RepID=UPI0018D8068A|nr:hypothetical protein [Bradyrhizobium glycinis]MBH5371165.1 hypothetical protein [Bradyrhizobium glycinis]